MRRVRSLMCAFLCLNGSLFAAADKPIDAGDEYVMIGKIHEIFCQTAAQASEYGLSVEPVAAHELVRDASKCSLDGFELHAEHTVYTPRGHYLLIKRMSGDEMAYPAFKQALLRRFNGVFKGIIRPDKKNPFQILQSDIDLASYVKALKEALKGELDRDKKLALQRESPFKSVSAQEMQQLVGKSDLIVSFMGRYTPVYEIKL